uniref:Uncharacterized protein n=1 Tax=Micrurus corallinus TaxID=54390 RepID=A0A2D4GXD3_MICCO
MEKKVRVSRSILCCVRFSFPKRGLPATLPGLEARSCSLARVEFSCGFRNYKVISAENQGSCYLALEEASRWKFDAVRNGGTGAKNYFCPGSFSAPKSGWAFQPRFLQILASGWPFLWITG